MLIMSCSAEPDEMIQIYDKHQRERLVNVLSANDIPYKLANDIQIYYPISYREKVKKAQEEIWGPVDNSKNGASVNAEVASSLASELNANGIPFNVISTNEKSTFLWPAEYNKKAMEVVQRVVK